MLSRFNKMFVRANVLSLFALLAHASYCGTEGWENICPGRRTHSLARNIWNAPLAKGLSAFDVEWRDGATGTVSMVKMRRGPAIEIAKRNAVGYVVVRPKSPFGAPPGTRLRAYAGSESRDADCGYSYGFLVMHGGKERLSHFSKFDRFGRGGPKQTLMANTPPGMPDMKFAHFETDSTSGTNVYAAIVVAGAPSVSIWSGWGVEDFGAASASWWKAVRERRPPGKVRQGGAVSDGDFDAGLAADIDHTAKVEWRDGYSKFILDGKVQVPVFFKGSTSEELKGFYGGAKMEAVGMNLQSMAIRLGTTKGQAKGYWSKDGFDAAGAVAEIRKSMKLAPSAQFLLSVDVSAYPEFAEEHPEEVWINDEGRKVFGHNTHSAYSLPKKMDPKRHWHWVSNHSPVWRDAVNGCLSELISELRRTGLSKRIVGVHLAGYHDAQFATVHPDYSKPAIAGFRRWLRTRYSSERELRGAWNDDKVTFSSATPPVLHDNFGKHNYFSAVRDRAIADYSLYLKIGPFRVQEDMARHVKKCFGKDIVVVRYCMSPFGGTWNAAYDITPFVKSDAIDILCAQPNYGNRVPGVPCGVRLPLSSFHRHGKLYLDEFDLRTYGALTSWEDELATMSFSRATDDPMWCAINRKLAGRMYAQRMGWWYLDTAGGWFEPDGIAADIADTLACGRELEKLGADGWHPDVAFVFDEEGALMRNLISHYFNMDEQVLNGEQFEMLAGSGVPLDRWLLDDWMEDPSLASRYKTIVFAGLYDIDPKRRRILEGLRSGGRTLVFLAGTGVSRGVETLGIELGEKPFPAQHEVKAEPGVRWNMNSLAHAPKIVSLLGVSGGWPWQFNSPPRHYVKENPAQKVLARYTEDGTAAVVEKMDGRGKIVYVASFGGLSPQYFHHLAAESGAYVPAAGAGLQVDMNGSFMSLHCLRGGEYGIRPPRAGKVVNMKSGKTVDATGGTFKVRMTAGETRWYRLR